MITESQLMELQNLFKRSALIEKLAQEEINRDLIWSEFDLRRAIRQCGINESITRADIDYKKEWLNHKELQKIISQRDNLLEKLKVKDTPQLRTQIIKLSDEQQDIQNIIRKKYFDNE